MNSISSWTRSSSWQGASREAGQGRACLLQCGLVHLPKALSWPWWLCLRPGWHWGATRLRCWNGKNYPHIVWWCLRVPWVVQPMVLFLSHPSTTWLSLIIIAVLCDLLLQGEPLSGSRIAASNSSAHNRSLTMRMCSMLRTTWQAVPNSGRSSSTKRSVYHFLRLQSCATKRNTPSYFGGLLLD